MKLVWLVVSICLIALTSLTASIAGDPRQAREEDLPEVAAFDIPDSISPACLSIEELQASQLSMIPNRLDIEIPDVRGWNTNLLEALASPYDTIGVDYKRDFRGFVKATYANGRECRMPAEIRISGDFKDHIAWKEHPSPVASLDVQLLEDSIGGIVRFKLFLPGTRSEDGEILMTELLRTQGVLAPRTFRISTLVNDSAVTYLFQEKLAKELIENNGLRESALVEADEELYWQTPTIGREESVFAKALNSSWVRRGSSSTDIGWRAIQSLTRAIAATWQPQVELPDGTLVPNMIPAQLLSTSPVGFLSAPRIFDSMMLAAGAWHGLRPHNRRFYFNAITGDVDPVYYDGEPGGYWGLVSESPESVLRYLATEKSSALTPSETTTLAEALQTVLTAEFQERLEHLGADFTEQELREWVQAASRNLAFLTQDVPPNHSPRWTPDPHSDFSEDSIRLAFGENQNELSVCSPRGDCTDRIFSSEESEVLFDGSLTLNNLPVKYAGRSREEYLVGNDPSLPNGSLRTVALVEDTQILATGYVDVKRGPGKSLSISAPRHDARVLMIGGHLNDWAIDADWPNEGVELPDQRFDENLLTGCLTILETQMNSTSISISGGGCEDSLNLMRVTGDMDRVEVQDAFQDGLDIDFSDVQIDSLLIKRTGNDCLDLSAGAYQIGSAQLIECSDKGVSVGEGAAAEVDDLSIFTADLGVAVKDSSVTTVKNLSVDEIRLCAAVYRKKQEFGGARLKIDRSTCTEQQLLVQSGSRLEFTDASAD